MEKNFKKGFYSGNYIKGPELVLQSCVPAIAVKHNIELIFGVKVQQVYGMIKKQEQKTNLMETFKKFKYIK